MRGVGETCERRVVGEVRKKRFVQENKLFILGGDLCTDVCWYVVHDNHYGIIKLIRNRQTNLQTKKEKKYCHELKQ